MGAMLRVVNLAIARKLVGLLSMLAPALAVALAGHAAVAAVRAARFAQRQHQINQGQRVVHAFGLLAGASRGQGHRGPGFAEQVRGFHDVFGRDSRDALDPVRPVRHNNAPDLVPSGRAGRNKVMVQQAIGGGDMQEAVCERKVRAGRQRQMQRRQRRCGSPARVGNNERPAVFALPLEILHHRRHGLGGVAADQQNGVRAGNVFQRERQAPI